MSKFKRALSAFLAIAIVFGMFSFLGSIYTPVVAEAAEGTSKIDSYADLVALYGTNVGDDGLVDGFVYVGTEYYEADGKLTDYYVQPGDRLTARLYVKSNMYCGDGILVSLYDNKFFDVKELADGSSKNATTGYCQNFKTDLVVNKSHPMVERNAVVCTMTSQTIGTIGWIKQLCGFDTTYMNETDLVQCAPTTNVSVSTLPYEFTSDDWYLTYYIDVKEGLADGTVGEVSSPEVLWPTTLNSTTGKHDQRRKSYMPCSEKTAYVAEGKVLITDCLTMANALDCGQCDYVIKDDMNHTFTIGEPAGAPSTEGVSKIDSYADLVALYGTNVGDDGLVDGFVYVGTEYYEADGKLTDYYVQPGDRITARLYVKSNMYCGDGILVSLYDNKFFDVKELADGSSKNATTGYCQNFKTDLVVNKSHPMVERNAVVCTMTSQTIGTIGWIKQLCGFDTTYMNETDLVQCAPTTNVSVSTLPYEFTSDDWYLTYYIDVKTGLADGTVGEVSSPEVLWPTTLNSTTGKHDQRRKSYMPCSEKTAYVAEGKVLITDCLTMANALDCGQCDYVIKDDMNHTFIIGNPPAGGTTYAASFKVDGEVVSTANYAAGAEIAAPADAPVKEGYSFLGWAVEGAEDTILTFPQTMGNAAVTYVAVFKEIVKYTATFIVDGQTYGEVKSYAEGEAIVAPTDPSKTGYTFKGWNPTVGTMGTAAVTFTAQWTAINYSVSFYKEKTDSSAYQTLPVAYDGAYSKPVDPDKLGYEFAGWVDADGNAMPATHTIAGNISYYASWTAGTFNAVFMDGDTVLDTVPTVFGEAIVAPADPSKTGYTFKGWDPEVGNMTAEGMTFKAVWEAAQIGVHFMDGETELKLLTGSFGSDIAAMSPNPTKEGYTFDGWTYEDGTKADFPITLGAEPVYVYAKWNPNSYYIEFYGPTENDWITGGTQLCGNAIVTPDAPTKTGYTFTGWVDANGNAMPETVPAIDNQVYYASYEATQYDAIFLADGVEHAKVSGAYQSSITAPDVPTKEGYTFKHWSKQGSTSKVTFPQKMPLNGVTYVAQWTINNYDIEYYVDGALVHTDNYDYGEAVTAWTYTPAEGVSFSGWGDQVPATMPANVVKVYGTTGTASYSVTFTIDGEEFQTVSVAFGAAIPVPEAPAKEGYTFGGWNVPATMPAGNQTYDATYTINKYWVRFWLDDGMTNLYQEFELEYGATINYPVAPSVDGLEFIDWDDTPATVPAEDVNIIAMFNEIIYFIEFVDEEGVVIDGYEFESVWDDEITADMAPSDEVMAKEGYDFLGWYVDGVKVTFPVIVNGDITFEAAYDVQGYKVNYYVDGELYDYDSYQYGDAIALRDALAQEGHTFSGWKDADGADAVLPATMPANDIDVYGTWTVLQYTATFLPGEGAFAGGEDKIEILVNYGEIPVAPAPPVLQGYGFAGWTPALAPMGINGATYTAQFSAGQVNYTVETYTMGTDGVYGAPVVETKSAETGTPVSEAPVAVEGFAVDGANSILSGVVAADGSTVLKIYFSRNQYDLTISIDGTDTTKTYYYAADVDAQADPEKTGYSFIKWSEAIPATMPAKNMTITAIFDINEYTITFVDTGDKTYAPITQDYNTAINAVSDPIKTGYTFTGWINAIGEAATVPATMPAGDLELTATWAINEYTITFVDTGDVAYAPITQDYDTAIDAVADPVKEGHKFLGWIDEAGKATTIPAAMPATDLVITADWEVLYYDATFMIDGKATVISTAFGSIPAAPTPTKVGYRFDGWDTEVVAMVVGGATYTAQFTALTYDAIFDANGGAWADASTQQVVPTVFDTAIVAPAENPTREAYIFAGWTPEVGNMTTEGITFTAVWTNDTNYCRVQEVKLINPTVLTSVCKAVYEIKVMGSPVKVQIAGGEGYTFTWTYDRGDDLVPGDLTEAGLVSIVSYDADGNVVTDDSTEIAYEMWKVVTMLSEGDYKVRAKVGYTTDSWESIEYAKDYTVKFEDIEEASEVIKTVTPAENVVKRGNTSKITVVADASVTRLRLVMTKADGTNMIVSYSPAATSSVTVTDNGDGTNTWVLTMRFTYTGTDLEQDQSWVVWYRVSGNSSWIATEKTADVKVTKYLQTDSPAEGYAAYSIISVSAPATAEISKYTEVVVKTTSDVTKVRLGYNGKTSTYLKTSRNLVYVDNGDGTATWTISYRFNIEGDQTWTVQCRGNKWSEITDATQFTLSVA